MNNNTTYRDALAAAAAALQISVNFVWWMIVICRRVEMHKKKGLICFAKNGVRQLIVTY